MSAITRHTWPVILLALLVVCSSAHGQTKSMIVEDEPRSVAKALEYLEVLYGWPMTYEDAPYVHESDLVDITAQVSRAKVDDKILGIRRVNISFVYDGPSTYVPSKDDLPKALRAIREVLHSYNTSYGAEVFTLMQSDTTFHVVPIQLKNASGQIAKITPLLDTTISILPKHRTGLDLLREICRSLSLAPDYHVIVGIIPLKLFIDHTTTINASNETARSVIDRLFEEMNVPLSWQLFYDPGPHWYALNIHHVTPANK